jgi:hypothetical protein
MLFPVSDNPHMSFCHNVSLAVLVGQCGVGPL